MIREKLLEASFKNVSFLVEDESATRGKKSVVHEYPNSDRRFFEGLGKLPPVLTINALLHGHDALQQRFNLERVLEEPGTGELVHPVYGVLRVSAGEFSVSSNQRRIGEFRFSIPFYTTERNISPTPETPTKQTVSDKAQDARVAIDDAITGVYTEPVSGLNLTESADKLTDVFAGLASQILGQKSLISQKSAEFTREIQDQLGVVFSTAKQAQDVQIALSSVYDSALLVVDSPALLLEAWKSVAEFNLGANGSTSDVGPVNTVQRKQRQDNLNVLDEHARLSGLINSYESSSYVDYLTEVEVDEAREFLDATYKNYVEDAVDAAADAGITPLVLAQTVRETLSSLRDASKKALDEAEQNVWRVVDIKPRESSMALVAYRYFGSLDNLDAIKGLNPAISHANFDQQIKSVAR